MTTKFECFAAKTGRNRAIIIFEMSSTTSQYYVFNDQAVINFLFKIYNRYFLFSLRFTKSSASS